jgi:hypothetical protein
VIFLICARSYVSPFAVFIGIWITSVSIFLFTTENIYAKQFVAFTWVIFGAGFLYGALILKIGSLSKRKRLKLKHGINISESQLKKISFILLLALLSSNLAKLFFTGNAEGLQGNVLFAHSKSPLIYTLDSIVNSIALSFALFLVIIRSKLRRNIFWYCFFLAALVPLVPALLSGFYIFKATSMVYLNKIFMPIVNIFLLLSLKFFMCESSKKSIKRFLALCCFSILLIQCFIIFEFDSVLMYKIISRADFYPLINHSLITDLSDIYGGNIFYFFHPFLKLAGTAAYEAPMGSYVLATQNGFSISQVIGGPNVHLPIVLWILASPLGEFGSSVAIFSVGVFLGIIFVAAVNRIFISDAFNSEFIFKSFIFLNTPLLIVEPSAWGHQFFFFVIIYFFFLVSKIMFGSRKLVCDRKRLDIPICMEKP